MSHHPEASARAIRRIFTHGPGRDRHSSGRSHVKAFCAARVDSAVRRRWRTVITRCRRLFSHAVRRRSVIAIMRCFAALALSAMAWSACALAPETLHDIALGDNDAKAKAIAVAAVSGDIAYLPLLQAVLDGEVQTVGDAQILLVKGDTATDLLTGKAVTPLPENRDDVVINNRIRKELRTAIAALKLTAPERAIRLAAARELQTGADEELLPAIGTALAKETDDEIKSLLLLTQASIQLTSKDKNTRLAAIRTLAESNNSTTKTLLLGVLEQNGDTFAEPDADVRAEAEKSLHAVQGRLSAGEMVGRVFSGISLGSILLLAALGLAITYGLMGVINMAHGELIMIGAYTTYVVQNLFKNTAWFDWYLAAAVPAAFLMPALVGMALERSVIRWLYGRPLETLLATWGISLMLIQAVRTVFGAANVQVENPAFMSGGIEAISGVVLP